MFPAVPSPSWPRSFWPQHLTPPPDRSAQTWAPSADSAFTPLLRPNTSTGVDLFPASTSPSWPASSLPQHLTPPAAVSAQLNEGAVSISPPDPSVAEWPLIGEPVYDVWNAAAENLEGTINKFSDELRQLGGSVVRFAGSMAIGIIQFVVSIIIAGVFLVGAEGGYRTSLRFSSSLVGDRGEALTDLAVATIRSVAKGVLGVAIIQALLSAVGLVLIGVPAAGIWTFVVLMMAIMQLPPLIILAPISVWVFSVADPIPATIFAVYAFIVSASDGFLKPLFLGRGMDIPMLVILLGAIGGMIMSGIVGLFIGAIVLALGYQILMAWMETDELNNPRQPADEAEAS